MRIGFEFVAQTAPAIFAADGKDAVQSRVVLIELHVGSFHEQRNPGGAEGLGERLDERRGEKRITERGGGNDEHFFAGFQSGARFLRRPGLDQSREMRSTVGERVGRIEAGEVHRTPSSLRRRKTVCAGMSAMSASEVF